jgi:hypothetical protein
MRRLWLCLSLFVVSVLIADGPTGVLVSSTLALKEFVTERLGGG